MKYEIKDIKIIQYMENDGPLNDGLLLDYKLIIDDKFSINTTFNSYTYDEHIYINFYITTLYDNKLYTIANKIPNESIKPKFNEFECSDFEEDDVPLIILKNINRWIQLYYDNEKINKIKEYIKYSCEDYISKKDKMLKEIIKNTIDYVNIVNKE